MKPEFKSELIEILKDRFEKNMARHADLQWNEVEAKLSANFEKLKALWEMEQTGGEPDVITPGDKINELSFCDCSPESPSGRRSICYDRAALEARKKHKPRSSVIEMATSMGVELLTEEQYRYLQSLGQFDRKTSSWIQTPTKIRDLGGALFCDRRYDTVFTYHNGADSYYAARGFRALLRV